MTTNCSPGTNDATNDLDDSPAAARTLVPGQYETAGPARSPGDSMSRERIGQSIGKYQVTGILGAGGVGVVFKAHDTIIERDVAIKILSPEVSEDEANLQRFLAEARAAGRLSHPHVVPIHEVAEYNGTYCLVMEYLPGGSVADQLSRGKFLPLEATQIASDACKGLSAAHAAGLVHRDIKPANLLRSGDGTVKVADFGLVKGSIGNARQITQVGQVVGTPYFMSPEQCESRLVDHRSDIYSLGATYYALLTGANPYAESGSTMQVMYAHCHSEVLDPRRVDQTIPEACSKVVARAMSKNPEDRYQTADEMLSDLRAISGVLSGETRIELPSESGSHMPLPPALRPGPHPAASHRRRPALLVAGAVILLAAVGATVLHFTRGNGADDGSRNGNGANENSGTPVAPSGDPIKVGVLHSLSGTMANSESGVVDAVLLAIEEVNKSGGLNGRPVKAIVRDGRSDPAVFAREAESLISDQKVCVVFGCWTSASRKTVVPILEKHDHLLIYPVQYEGVEESPNVVYTGAAPNQQIIPAVKWAFESQKKRRFFLVGSDYVFPRVANEIIKDNLKELGATLVGEEYFPLGSSRVADVVKKIVAARPDVILNTINGDTNVAFFRALRAAGVTSTNATTISFSIGENELRHLDVQQIAGDYAAWNYFQTLETPENKEFVAKFHEKYGPQRVVTDPMESAYFSVKLWAAAVTSAQTDAVSSVRRAIRNKRYRAPSGEVRIDPATQHTFKTPRIGKIRPDGQFDVIWTAPQPRAPEPYPKSRSAERWRALLNDLYRKWGNRWSAPTE